MKLPEKVTEKLKKLPDKPGCYMMRDRKGQIIYVGKAISLRKRVQSYFRDSTFTRGDPKLRSLVKSVCDIDFMIVKTEAEAILTEGRLIKDYKPYYNVALKDDKRFILLRADAKNPFPMFKLCRLKRDDGALYFGPYVSTPAARAALDFIEKRFGLRKCAPRVPDDETYKHCINDIVRYCSAPCVGKISQDGYAVQFDEACAFVRGERPEYLKELRRTMDEAAEKLDFEKAAAIRDTLFRLHEITKKKARVAPTPAMRREETRSGLKEIKNVLGLKKIPGVIEAFDISNISGTYSVGSMVCFVDGMPRGNRYRRFRIKTVEHSDDPRMMGEVVKRRFSRLNKEGGELPDLVLVDGGITQLRSAQIELEKLGLSSLPVAGLAKKFEEIYYGDGISPLRLEKKSSALKLLQRLRDEAHRFAIAYHHKLRNRRIRESVLDDIPGIGNSKKEEILKHFGSVARLTKASKEHIAEVKGIGMKQASVIYEAIRSNKKDKG